MEECTAIIEELEYLAKTLAKTEMVIPCDDMIDDPDEWEKCCEECGERSSPDAECWIRWARWNVNR